MNLFRFSCAPAALLALLLASTADAQTPPAPQPAWMSYANPLVPTVPTPEHLQAAGALADALGLEYALLAELHDDGSAAQRDFDARFLAQFKHEEMLRRASPAYAELFTLEEARALVEALRTPGAGRALRYLHLASVPGPERATRQVLRELKRSSAGKKLLASGNEMQAAKFDLLTAWRRAYADQLIKPSIVALLEWYRARQARGDASEPVLFVPPPSGIAYVDAQIAVIGQTLYRAAHTTWLLDHDLAALGSGIMMTPQTLADAAGLPQRRAALEKIDARVRQLRAEQGADRTASLNAFGKIDMPFRSYEQRVARPGGEGDMLGDTQVADSLLALIDVMRRVLAFAESSKGKLQVRAGALVFANDADRARHDALMEEVRREGGRYDRLRAEAALQPKKILEKINP